MKKALLFAVLLAACGNRSGGGDTSGEFSTADSTIIRSQADSGPLTDTDDHNKPSVEGIVLDSPVGPDTGADTVKRKP